MFKYTTRLLRKRLLQTINKRAKKIDQYEILIFSLGHFISDLGVEPHIPRLHMTIYSFPYSK